MSPWESGVKPGPLACPMPNDTDVGENEAGNHKIWSLASRAGLKIGRCDSKDSRTSPPKVFLVNGARRPKSATMVDPLITLWL